MLIAVCCNLCTIIQRDVLSVNNNTRFTKVSLWTHTGDARQVELAKTNLVDQFSG